MPWQGKPKWNGKIADIDLNKCLIPWHAVYGPCLVLLEGCGDNEPFMPIFPTPEKLQAHMMALIRKGIIKFLGFQIKQIDNAHEFMSCLRENGIRLMYDPEIVDEHHTRWKEVVYSGEEWKFVDPETN